LKYYTTLVLNYLYFKLYLQIINKKEKAITGETQTIALENNFARLQSPLKITQTIALENNSTCTSNWNTTQLSLKWKMKLQSPLKSA
jgi:hypothetical protein